MVQKPRVWYPGAIYRIMCRGNHHHEILRDDEDRQVYLENLLWAKGNPNHDATGRQNQTIARWVCVASMRS